MAINFPDTPSLNDTHTVGSTTWIYDGEKWLVLAPTIELDDLADVSAPSPSTGDFLKWDGTAWVPDSVASIESLDDIGDVNVVTASAGQVLTYDGANWVNQNPSIGSGNLDGGNAVSNYGGITALDGGAA